MNRLYILFTLLLALVVIVPVSYAFAAREESSPTQASLQQTYANATPNDPVRILIVPGHEPGYGGAEYQGVYEREITTQISDNLATDLKQNPKFEVLVARSDTSWNDDLAAYFEKKGKDIKKFVDTKKKEFAKLVKHGDFDKSNEGEQVEHAAAPSDVALRLYGINKWANENDIDLVVHVHINDAPDHGPDGPGANSGYTVYVPDSQYENSEAARPLARDIAQRLSALNATSTLELENKGVVEDQELIAIGANNTLNVPSVLVEYAYITEPKMLNPETRSTVVKDFAYSTYLGIQDYFNDVRTNQFASAALPMTFNASSTTAVGSSSPATYALQAALHSLGFYPSYGSTTSANSTVAPITLTMCPIDGVMGPCTTNAIDAFQSAKGWNATGKLGPQTLAALNAQFSNAPAPIVTAAPDVPLTTANSCSITANITTVAQKDTATDTSIANLQTVLAKDAALYPEKLVTGFYGPATQKAVQRFQLANGIVKQGGPGYGLVGPKTQAALNALCP